MITRERPIRDASAHEHDWHVFPPRLAQEIRPDLCFEHDYDCRLHRSQHSADTERPVKREEDHGVSKRHTFPRQLLPRLGRRRNDQGPLRVGFFQSLGQCYSRKGLAHRDRVNPDGSWPLYRGRRQRGKGQSQTLLEI